MKKHRADVLKWVVVGLLGPLAGFTQAHAAISLEVSNAQVSAGTGAKVLQTLFAVPPDAALAGGPQLEAQINQVVPQIVSNFNARISDRFAKLDTAGVLRAMANAGSGAARLQSNDYATDASVGSLSLGAGAVGNNFSLSDLKVSSINTPDGELLERGVSGNAGGTLTFHLRSLALPRWRFFDPARLSVAATFMRVEDVSVGTDVTVGLSNWGVRLSYQLLTGHAWARRGLARWGGLQVGLGLARSDLFFRFKGTLPNVDPVEQTIETDVPLGLRLGFAGDADLSFRLRSWTVPLEVWSHLQLGYLLTLYGGLGVDFNTSHATIDADLVSDSVKLSAFSTSDPSQAPQVIAQPSARLDAGEKASGVAWDGRAFAGLQVNLFYLALFAQASLDTAQNVGANVGLRAFY